MSVFRIFAATFGFTVVASASVSAENFEQYTLCKLRGEVRALRIDKDSEGKCRSTYTKLGRVHQIGEAQYMESCQDFVSRTRVNLEQADWKCRDVKTATITGAEPVSENE